MRDDGSDGQKRVAVAGLTPRAWLSLAASVLAVVGIALFVDLEPKVDSDFFFSTDSPKLQASSAIDELFPSSPQIFLTAGGPDLREPAYLERIGELTEALGEIEGVANVRSLTSGPGNPEAGFEGPFWSRLLVAETARIDDDSIEETEAAEAVESATPSSYLILQLEDDADERSVVESLEAAISAHEAPGFSIAASGIPFVVEQIRRSLQRDLVRFSLAALALFGLLTALIFRSLPVVLGTLSCAVLSCAVTLAILSVAGVPIGVLTANLATIVFVLTLSHTVFLTANTRRLASSETPQSVEPVRAGVRATLPASFWCMVTTLLGFLSLLLATAKPLRELGLAGAIGTVTAIIVAYLAYPAYLAGESNSERPTKPSTWPSFARLGPRTVRAAGLYLLVAAIAVVGLFRLNTDPGLLSFFKAGTPLAEGLAAIDRAGGSSPLGLVVSDPESERVDGVDSLRKVAALQVALESDPETGVVLSVDPLLAEARRVPLAGFLPPEKLLDLLEGEQFGGIAKNFITPDRDQAYFFLRMREAGRERERDEVVAGLLRNVDEAGLEAVHVGGLYELQGALSRLVAGSVLWGLGGLGLLFAMVAAIVSRSVRGTIAMVASLVTVPVICLGTLGLIGLPIDIISAPAANVAIAMGIDSMIHLALRARELSRTGPRTGRRSNRLALREAWGQARAELAQPIVAAIGLVAVGFGIFALSSFPPTQRFGLAVVLGTLAAAFAALWLVPLLAAGRQGASDRDVQAPTPSPNPAPSPGRT